MKCNCGCAFCGWCMADCGRDAHPHVKQCPGSANPGSYHGSVEQFESTHRDRRRIAVLQYLASLPQDDAAKVRCACYNLRTTRERQPALPRYFSLLTIGFSDVRCGLPSLKTLQNSGFHCSRRAGEMRIVLHALCCACFNRNDALSGWCMCIMVFDGRGSRRPCVLESARGKFTVRFFEGYRMHY